MAWLRLTLPQQGPNMTDVNTYVRPHAIVRLQDNPPYGTTYVWVANGGWIEVRETVEQISVALESLEAK